MNKNKKIIIALIAVILLGTVFVVLFKLKKIIFEGSDSISTEPVLVVKHDIEESGKVPTLGLDLDCLSGWQEYHQDVLGIAFCFPVEWGSPMLDPIKNITRLSDMEGTFKAKNTYYENSLSLLFEKNDKVRLKIFNESYTGKSERGIEEPTDYYQSGTNGDVVNLKKNGDVCGYKINFEYRYDLEMAPVAIRPIYDKCLNGARTVLTEEDQYFNFDNIGTLYTYDLKLLAFKKLKNKYFDNVLVNRSVDRASQIQEKLQTLEEFYGRKKTTKVEGGLPEKTSDQVDHERKEFEIFVNTINAYGSVSKAQEEFKQIASEDRNVATIRKYYWLIGSGNFNEAYAMYADKAGTSPEEFKNRYGNAYSAEPIDFRQLDKNRYEFQVKYRDHNSEEELYHVIMEVDGSLVRTTFLEKYQTEMAKFGGMTAYAARRGDKNYVLLNKDGKEIIIDRGKADYNEEHTNLADVKNFYGIRFSPTGDYLVYSMSGWEWAVAYIYDIQKGQNISGAVAGDLGGGHTFDFANNEKNFYLCSSAGMASGSGGKVYSVPGFETEFDLLVSYPESKNYMNVDCPYDEATNSILFKLSEHTGESEAERSKKETLRYDLSAKKVE